ncbi:long-chain fatty acid--CoA ligase [Cupriavidus basilensis]|uniref:Long-chain fatty acid--CoA ligase n=1 Tax=Cupriavidus basilensis TaxID=68895 RepID=A0ABT6ALK4_9BURK|nr:long-chain fatty acid--CoA ligase [Cupriavidus basilensis]MDF3833490.1 long-chain fatty acid--CoA ligase [Cupriavidus basilensis]
MTGKPSSLSPGDSPGMLALGMADWLCRRAARGPQRPALTCAGQTWTYAELVARTGRMATVLAAGGVQPGQRVGYLGLNDPLFLVTQFACGWLGAVFVPLNFRLTGPELAFIVNDAGVHTLFADDGYTGLIDEVRPRLECQRYLGRTAAPGWEGLDALMAKAAQAGAVPPLAATHPDDVAAVMYTSGTTGNPKGAMLTHGNFWSNNLNVMLMSDIASTDVALNFAPLFHVGGMCCVTLPILMAGGHLVLQRSFDPAGVMQDVAEHRVTVSFAVPAMLLFVSQHPDFERADLSSLRSISVGGAPMPEPLLRLFSVRGIPVNQGYGLTETAAATTFLAPERAHDKLGSCGTPAFLTEVCVRAFDGTPVTAPHERGELCARGANVMKGYWNRPDATAGAFYEGGWFRTGDVGYADEEGFYYICDRLKDMVITGGENVYPAEVESVLYEHPAIAEVAVIGAPDPRWGEHVVAVVALKPGASLTLEALQAFAETRLARYKLPRELRVVAALPRNPTGKVLKIRLREQATA